MELPAHQQQLHRVMLELMIMNEISKIKIVETSLVLTTGFLGLYFVFKKPVFLIIAFVFGITGIFIPFLARVIAIAWFKLADVLNFVVSKIILGFVYFIVLVPVAFIYKMVGKDKLSIKKRIESNWILSNKKYNVSDIENTW